MEDRLAGQRRRVPAEEGEATAGTLVQTSGQLTSRKENARKESEEHELDERVVQYFKRLAIKHVIFLTVLFFFLCAYVR